MVSSATLRSGFIIVVTGVIVLTVTPLQAAWTDTIRLKGDIRYQHDSVDWEGQSHRTRHVLRIRASLLAKLSEELDAEIRVASGSGNPTSTNVTMDNGFSGKSLWLDLFSVTWRPALGLALLAGKVKNPLVLPGGTELIWDSDVNPEGLAATYTSPNKLLGFFVTGTSFWVDERKNDSDALLYAAQAGVTFAPQDSPLKLKAGGGYLAFTETKGYPTFVDAAKSFGNSVDRDGNYANDYHLVEAFTEAKFKAGTIPVAVAADYVVNTEADVEDSAWLVGFTVGERKDKGSWLLRYNYRRLEQDAILGVFTDGSFGDGTTNHQGHELGFDYQASKAATLGLSYYGCELGLIGESLEYHRFQAEFVVRF